MEGYLLKQGKRMKQWWKRYFVLDNETLRYYSYKGGVLRAEIDISRCSAKIVHRFLIGKDYTFQILAKETFLVVCASNEAEMHNWLQALNGASGGINNCSGSLSPGSEMVALAARRQDDEIYEVKIEERRHLRSLMSEFDTRNERILIKGNVDINSIQVSSGSLLLAINQRAIINDNLTKVQDFLYKSSFPMTLQFLKVKRKHGILRIMPYEGLNNVFSSWKERLCVLEGEYFTYLRKNDVCDKTEISLKDCSVKVVHKFLAGREFCFMISSKTCHLLFQALSADDLMQWIGAVAHAAEVTSGRILNAQFSSIKSEAQVIDDDNLSRFPVAAKMPERKEFRDEDLSKGLSENDEDVYESLEAELLSEKQFLDLSTISRSVSDVIPQKITLAPPSDISRGYSQPNKHLNSLSVVDLITHYQCREKFVEAIQLMRKNSQHRREYWAQSFAWALEPTTLGYFNSLLQTKLSQRDEIQLAKDVPRTTNWLEHSSGVMKLDSEATAIRLGHLERVLHAYIASCAIVGEASNVENSREEPSPSAYLQGMNGITFVLLEAFHEDESEAFRFLTGIVEKLLPSIFESDSFGQETLGQTGQFFECIISSYLPQVVQVFERVGLPVFILSYKWFPTLFSDISLTAGNRQMPFPTILAAWDVCFLMGMDGAICVALALFAAAQGVLLALPKDCLAEDVGFALNNVLAELTPEWLLDGVCVVIDTCKDSKLKKLRFQHLKLLHRAIKRKSKSHALSNSLPIPALAYEQEGKSNSKIDKKNVSTQKLETLVATQLPLTARNLDTGEVYVISEEGMTLHQNSVSSFNDK